MVIQCFYGHSKLYVEYSSMNVAIGKLEQLNRTFKIQVSELTPSEDVEL